MRSSSEIVTITQPAFYRLDDLACNLTNCTKVLKGKISHWTDLLMPSSPGAFDLDHKMLLVGYHG